MTAVAAKPNGKDFAEVVFEGVDCEVLAWAMSVEEPMAEPRDQSGP